MIKRGITLVILLVAFVLMPPYLKVNSYNSMSEYDTVVQNENWFNRNIGKSNLLSKITITYGNFANRCFPVNLDDDIEYCTGSKSNSDAALGTSIGIAGAFAIIAAVSGPAALVFGAAFFIPVVITAGSYHVIRPDEYVNMQVGSALYYEMCGEADSPNPYDCNTVIRCSSQDCDLDNVYAFHAKGGLSPITPQEMPFFFHCDPTWDPTGLYDDTGYGGAYYEQTWGYSPEFCEAWTEKESSGEGYILKHNGTDISSLIESGEGDVDNLIGSIIIAYDNVFWSGIPSISYPTTWDGLERNEVMFLKAGQGKHNSGAYIYAYYKYDSGDSKYKLCAANTVALLPVEIGCTYVPPPKGMPVSVSYFDDYIGGTRCEYLNSSRKDLKSLAVDVLGWDSETTMGGSSEDVKVGSEVGMRRFLMGDMHAISITYGCIYDLLVNFFATTTTGQSTFQEIQENFKSIVLVILTLYLVVVGIKLISSPQPVKMGDAIMMMLKFSLVTYFAIGDAWYNFNGSGAGIYHMLMDGGTYIASFFTEGLMSNDPLGFCRYEYTDGEQLLRDRIISGGSEVTSGFTGIKLTVMDLLDCKMGTYFNFSMCNYSAVRTALFWIIGVIMFASLGTFFYVLFSGMVLVLLIALITYCVLMLMIAFKYVYISILALFIITVLVFLSPIFVVFALFDSTKQIFDSYVKMLLGYMIYPALLFAFISLMLATLDSVYYGIDDATSGPLSTADIVEKCQSYKDTGDSSLFCIMVNQRGGAYEHPCLANNVSLFDLFQFDYNSIQILGIELTHFYSLGNPGDYFKEVAKLTLFAFLFYLFMQSVNDFLAIMVSTRSLGDDALGSFVSPNLLTAADGKIMGVSKKTLARGVLKGTRNAATTTGKFLLNPLGTSSSGVRRAVGAAGRAGSSAVNRIGSAISSDYRGSWYAAGNNASTFRKVAGYVGYGVERTVTAPVRLGASVIRKIFF